MLTIKTASLRTALALVKGAIEVRNTIPILACVKIATDETGAVFLTGTDMEVALTVRLDAQATEAFSAVIPHKPLSALLKGSKAEVVALDAEEVPPPKGKGKPLAKPTWRVHVKLGGSAVTLAGMDVADFPGLKKGELKHAFDMPAAELGAAFGAVRHAISTEQTRYYLNGICFDTSRQDGPDRMGRLACVTTDGHRLGKYMLDRPASVGRDAPRIVIPAGTVKLLLAVLKGQGQVRMEWSDTRAWWTVEGVTLASKLIDGTFPEYDRAIPHHIENRVVVDAVRLAEVAERVASISQDRSSPVKLFFSKAGEVVVFASNSDGAVSAETLNGACVNMVSPFDMEIGFQMRYLKDALEQCGPLAVMMLQGMSGPAVFHPADDDPGEPRATFVVMPMRI